MYHDHDDPRSGALARREVLTLLGATAGGAVLGTFLRGPLPGRSRRRVFGAATASAADASCIVRPEMTEGPYFVDERLNRSDIRSDPSDGSVRPGVQLALTFVVSRIDDSSCTPFEGAVVDVWHCDAGGIYSDVQDTGFDTVGEKFLRGYQVTDASGVASFVTIYPGWYQGRTVHVHFKARAAALLDRAASRTGARQTRLNAKAHAKLENVLTVSQAAALNGTLGVALAPITAAVEALLDLL